MSPEDEQLLHRMIYFEKRIKAALEESTLQEAHVAISWVYKQLNERMWAAVKPGAEQKSTMKVQCRAITAGIADIVPEHWVFTFLAAAPTGEANAAGDPIMEIGCIANVDDGESLSELFSDVLKGGPDDDSIDA